MFKTLTPIFAIVIAIAIYFFFTQPMFADIRSVQDETERYREAVQNAKTYNETLQSLLNNARSMSSEQRMRLEALVPQTVDEIQLIVDLEAIAEAYDLLIGNFEVDSSNDSIVGVQSTDEVRTIDELAFVDISFGLIGTYDDFRAMLRDVEQSLYRLEVISIDFSAGESELQQYNVTVRSYALPSS